MSRTGCSRLARLVQVWHLVCLANWSLSVLQQQCCSSDNQVSCRVLSLIKLLEVQYSSSIAVRNMSTFVLGLLGVPCCHAPFGALQNAEWHQ